MAIEQIKKSLGQGHCVIADLGREILDRVARDDLMLPHRAKACVNEAIRRTPHQDSHTAGARFYLHQVGQVGLERFGTHTLANATRRLSQELGL